MASNDQWLRIRVVLYCLAFLIGLAVPIVDAELHDGLEREIFVEMTLVPRLILIGVGAAILLVFGPLVVLYLVTLSTVFGASEPKWERPHHSMNPFQLRRFLPILHFAVYLGIAQSIGVIVSGSWKGPLVGLLGFGGLILAISFGLGLRLCYRIFASRMRPREDERNAV